jgi:hypothetical protein
MKLRFRGNSLRLRVNQREVRELASGSELREEVRFPGDAKMSYVLRSASSQGPGASFEEGAIVISAPQSKVERWASSDEIGMYFNLPAGPAELRVAIEKDLECVDGPPEERDPEAFPRTSTGKNC